jgi:hypothetical protein
MDPSSSSSFPAPDSCSIDFNSELSQTTPNAVTHDLILREINLSSASVVSDDNIVELAGFLSSNSTVQNLSGKSWYERNGIENRGGSALG